MKAADMLAIARMRVFELLGRDGVFVFSDEDLARIRQYPSVLRPTPPVR